VSIRPSSSAGPYVLVTAARNEDKFVATLVESVLAQTVLPKAFVIVSDGSRDQTETIVERYASEGAIVRLIRRRGGTRASFGSKALAIQEAVYSLADAHYEFVGVLDADITVEPHYFATLIQMMKKSPSIGIGGGVVSEFRRGLWVPLRYNYGMSVAGAVQMFRRECYDAVGGYRAMAHGGIDTVAETMARMHGWQVRTFPDLAAYHHRPVGSRAGGLLRAQFRSGMQEYANGYSLLFQLVRLFSRMVDRPYFVGSLARTFGFWYSFVRGDDVLVSEAIIRYLKREQLRQIVRAYSRLLGASAGQPPGRAN
jgi:poly-beta-1,6-N-acetyl-D-glucosamine synthase